MPRRRRHKAGRKAADAVLGGWFRGPYEVGEMWIVPEGASSFWDPWADYRQQVTMTHGRPLHQRLLDLARDLQPHRAPPWFLTDEGRSVLAGWIADHGPLGLLPHRLLASASDPGPQSFMGGVPRAEGQMIYTRSARGWRAWTRFPGPASTGAMEAWSLGRKTTTSEQIEPDAVTWRTYFPGEQNMPLPLSETFWTTYRESVPEFLSALDDFEQAAAALAWHTSPGQHRDFMAGAPELRESAVGRARTNLEVLLSPVQPAIVPGPGRRLQLDWPCTSLLASAAMMLAMSLTGYPWQRCPECRVLFQPHDKRQEHCGPGCRRGRKQANRKERRQTEAARLKKAKRAKKEGISHA